MEPTGCVGTDFLRADQGERRVHRFCGFHPYQGPPLGDGRKKGGLSSHHGTSRGGRTTNIHALSDDRGRPVAFALTPGNTHDLAGAKALLAIRCPSQKLLADRAYDAASLRNWLAEQGTESVIPPSPTLTHPHAYDRQAYRGRNLIGCSAALRTSAASPPVTTNAPTSSCQPYACCSNHMVGQIESRP